MRVKSKMMTMVTNSHVNIRSHVHSKLNAKNEDPTVVRTRDNTICNRMLYH